MVTGVPLRVGKVDVEHAGDHVAEHAEARFPRDVPEVEHVQRGVGRSGPDRLDNVADRDDLPGSCARDGEVTREKAGATGDRVGARPRIRAGTGGHDDRLTAHVGDHHVLGTQVESQHPWQEQFTQALGRLETREVEHVGAQLGAEVSGQRRAERRAILAPVGHRLDRAQFVLIDEERDGRGLPAKQRRDQDADDHRRADDRDRQQAEALDESADAA